VKRTVKVTIRDFSAIAENLNDPGELALYESANGRTYEAEIEPDGYAVVDVSDEDYIELAPGEYQIMIEDWTVAGKLGELTLETKSDPEDDKNLLYRGVDADGREVQRAQSLPKQVVSQLAKTWFGSGK
jgi:hypothetical protein